MAYDAKRKLLFIHIPKNAGTSVEAALGFVSSDEFNGMRESRRSRLRSLPSRSWSYLESLNSDPRAREGLWSSRSFLNRSFTHCQRRTADPRARERLWGVMDYSFVAQHLTYAEISLLGLIDPAPLQEAIKFAVCRNPYDHAVSSYFHHESGRTRSVEGFRRFIVPWLDAIPWDHDDIAHHRPQWQFCVDLHGSNVLERLIRFESLEEEFRAFAQEMLLDYHLKLGWIGKGQRTERTYREFYDAPTRRAVALKYEQDLDSFKYVY